MQEIDGEGEGDRRDTVDKVLKPRRERERIREIEIEIEREGEREREER